MLLVVGSLHSCRSSPSRLLPDLSTDTNIGSVVGLPVKQRLCVVRCSTSLRHQAEPGPVLSASLGFPAQWNVTHRHTLGLNLAASAALLFTAWVFFSAIPAMLAFRKAVESLEKQLYVTEEQLPDAMAAVRLSGMEISDLAMELSDLGQDITQTVKDTTRVATVAEEKLREFASLSAAEARPPMVLSATDVNHPPLAKSVRRMKEGIVKSRSALQMFFTFTHYLSLARHFFAARARYNTK
uniref:Uncharacterized protein n=1 Tax=Kalanchoe fedtschenkoi TaxID=63787 RepID=A0A7N0V7H6_KALFE